MEICIEGVVAPFMFDGGACDGNVRLAVVAWISYYLCNRNRHGFILSSGYGWFWYLSLGKCSEPSYLVVMCLVSPL